MRDIDDWFYEFERIAATLVKEIFEQDMGRDTPKKIIEQLERLRLAEEQHVKNEPT